MKQEHFLWQLLNIQNDFEKANEELDGEDNNLKRIVHELDTHEAEAKKKSKEKAGYDKEIQQCQRRIAETQRRLDRVRYLLWINFHDRLFQIEFLGFSSLNARWS